MASCKIDLRDVITQEAQRQGVDPNIALAVARKESGTCQWWPDGSTVVSSAGAIGVMQLMPKTAAALGVDPTDVNQNIRGGVSYLRQLFAKYGNWATALAAYNAGPGYIDSGKPLPAETRDYISTILGVKPAAIPISSAAALGPLPIAGNGSKSITGLLIIGGLVVVGLWIAAS